MLIDSLPVEINGVPLDTRHIRMVQFELLILDEAVPEASKIDMALALLYPRGYATMTRDEAWAGLLWFYSCGKPAELCHAAGEEQPRAYDFGEDAPLIVAAFQQAYGIDMTQGAIHWWRFRALFDGLPNDCRLSRVMEIRTVRLDELPKGAREYYAKLRALVALDRGNKAMTLAEHDAAFLARLRAKAKEGGG